MSARPILIVMIAAQAAWLLAIGLTGTVADRLALTWLLAGTAAVGAAVLWRRGLQSRAALADEAPWAGHVLWVLCPATFCVAVAYAIYQGPLPDESFMLAAARIAATRGIGVLFQDYPRLPVIGWQHPPLMPLVYGLAMRTIGDSPTALRAVPALFLVFTLVVLYRLGADLYDRTTGALSAVLFLAMPYVFRWGMSLLTDIAVTFFFALALLLTVRLSKRPSVWLALALGVAVGLGVLTKYTMGLVVPFVALYPLLAGRFRQSFPYLVVAGVIAGLTVLPWVVYAHYSGVLAFQSRRITGFSRIMTHAPVAKHAMTILAVRNLPSGIGVFNLPLLAVGAWGAVRARKTGDLFVLLWIGLVWVALLSTLPDPRYFMVTFPALAILMARACRAVPRLAPRAIVLGFCCCAGALYLYAAALRTALP